MTKLKNPNLFVFILCLLIDFANSFSQEPVIQWQNAIGGAGTDKTNCIHQTTDGGYIIGGYSSSDISGDKTENRVGTYDYWIIKLSADGSIEWQNTIGGTSDDILTTAIQTSDGGYVVGGYSKSPLSGDKTEPIIGGITTTYDYWILKLDAIGNIVWQNTIGGASDDYLTCLIETQDNGFLIGGYSKSGISGDKNEGLMGGTSYDYWILKINALGEIEWQNTIGGSGSDYLTCLCLTSDGGYMVGGYSASNISGDKTETLWGNLDYWVLKLSDSGVIEWQNTLGGNWFEYLTSIQQTNDGGYILGGYSDSDLIYGDISEITSGGYDYWVVKLDSSGSTEWKNMIGGSLDDYLESIHQTSSGEYIISGYSYSSISGDKTEANLGIYLYNDYWIINLNASGNIIWQNTLGGSNFEYAFSAEETIDGGYIIGGYSYSDISGDRTEASHGILDIWILKMGPDTCDEQQYYYDTDGDGFGSTINGGFACESPVGYKFDTTDCNDLYAAINPIAVEICDGFDNNCNGEIDEGLAECNPGPSIEWENTIGGMYDDILYDIRQTTDNGYILGGLSSSIISSDKTEICKGALDYWILKLDSLGNILWQNTIGGSASEDKFANIIETSDGGYILGGASRSNISGDKTENSQGLQDYWVIKINDMGEIEWQNTIGGTTNDELKTIIETSDGGYLLGGASSSSVSDDKTEVSLGYDDYWIVKLDTTGNVLWQNTIGGSGNEYLSSIIESSDGGYLLAGMSNSLISGDKTEGNLDVSSPYSYDYWVVKIDVFGNILWQNTIGGNKDDKLLAAVQSSDGGYLIGGYSYSGITGDKTEATIGGGLTYNDIWVVKIDLLGNILWQNDIGGTGNDYLQTIALSAENGFILGAYSTSSNNFDKIEPCLGNYDYWVINIDSVGNLVWQNTIGSTNSDQIQSISPTNDGGYILGGGSLSNHSGDKSENNLGTTFTNDYWIVKLNGSCAPTPELCNTFDDNCNGLIDDGITETISISAAGPTTFCQGGSVVLSATYSGATVQWKKDGVNIAGATSANYTVTKKGNYTCVTTSPCGTATSSIINVTVNKNPAASISAAGATTFCAGGSVTLTEVPSGGCTYQWYKGPSAIAGATSVNYIATTTGNYKCRVTKTATGCYKNSNAIAVSVPCREDEMNSNENNSFTLFPNPANDKLNIQINSQFSSSFLLTITDLQGREIYKSELNSPTIEINISDFASGMYFVKVKIDDYDMIEKFIKN